MRGAGIIHARAPEPGTPEPASSPPDERFEGRSEWGYQVKKVPVHDRGSGTGLGEGSRPRAVSSELTPNLRGSPDGATIAVTPPTEESTRPKGGDGGGSAEPVPPADRDPSWEWVEGGRKQYLDN